MGEAAGGGGGGGGGVGGGAGGGGYATAASDATAHLTRRLVEVTTYHLAIIPLSKIAN